MLEVWARGFNRTCHIQSVEKKRFAPGVFLILALGGGLITWALRSSREPVYDGRTLNFWLARYTSENRSETSQVEADHALEAIGTNAIPTLLRMLQSRDSAIEAHALRWLKKHPALKIRWNGAETKIEAACQGFQHLGKNGTPAVPALIKIYQHDSSDISRKGALVCLADIGPSASNAVPALVADLAEVTNKLTVRVLWALEYIHPNRDIELPALIRCLNNPRADANVIGYVADTLRRFKHDAAPAIPTLTLFAKSHSNLVVRSICARTLKVINPETNDKARDSDSSNTIPQKAIENSSTR